MRASNGFTLIELIIVIVVMGILAGVAVPSYLGFKSHAVRAKMTDLASTMYSAANLANGTSLIQYFPQTASGDLIVLGDGAAAYGFPKASAICDRIRLTGMTGVTCVNGVATSTEAATPAACKITYIEATSADAGPTVDVSQLTDVNC